MKKLVVFLILVGSSAAAQNVKVSRGLARHQALDAYIKNAATVHRVPPNLLKAIMCVESSCGKRDVIRQNGNGTLDVGVFQINSIHWAGTCAGYDVLTPRGNALCAGKLLKKHMRHQGADPLWPARYHSKTPSLKKKYWKKLKRYL